MKLEDDKKLAEFFLLINLAQEAKRFYLKTKKETGCKGREIDVLVFLMSMKDRTDVRSTILRKTGMKSPNLCAVLKSLEEKGMIERGSEIIVTEKGRESFSYSVDCYLTLLYENNFFRD